MQGKREQATAIQYHLNQSYGTPSIVRALQKQGSLGGSTVDIANFNKCSGI